MADAAGVEPHYTYSLATAGTETARGASPAPPPAPPVPTVIAALPPPFVLTAAAAAPAGAQGNSPPPGTGLPAIAARAPVPRSGCLPPQRAKTLSSGPAVATGAVRSAVGAVAAVRGAWRC